jgi:electron transfer flavoprotein beta subunit
VKQVPARDSNLTVENGRLKQADWEFEMNEPDAYALEEALGLREKAGGEVIVVSAGPERVQSTIREALAKGADRAIQVQLAEGEEPDAFVIAQLLANAVRSENADLILTGLQSDDTGYGQTGVILAELLGAAHATIVMQVEPGEGSVRVKRELEDGWFQYVTLPLPSVLTVQSGIKRLRYATLMGIKKAKTKEVRQVAAASLGTSGQSAFQVVNVHAPERAKESQIFTGDPKQAAHQLVEKLRFEARVL